MSRSYRKTLIRKERNPKMKRFANRIIRRKIKNPDFTNLKDGGHYRKIFDYWHISDWGYRYDPKTDYKYIRWYKNK